MRVYICISQLQEGNIIQRPQLFHFMYTTRKTNLSHSEFKCAVFSAYLKVTSRSIV